MYFDFFFFVFGAESRRKQFSEISQKGAERAFGVGFPVPLRVGFFGLDLISYKIGG